MVDSFCYTVPLLDRQGYAVSILAYGIDRITADIKGIEVKHVSKLFKGIHSGDLKRPHGQVDLLVGYDYTGA